jgi:hypothetical protein
MEKQVTKSHTSPKDFFMHLLAMVALYTSAISFTTVVWQLINVTIPDPVADPYYSIMQARDLMRNALAFLVVLFPVYLWVTWLLHKSYHEDSSKVNLRVRKWLSYFTLFAAALIVIFTLVGVMMNFLNGELTLRIGLKLSSLIFVAAAVFSYYLWDIKKYKVE